MTKVREQFDKLGSGPTAMEPDDFPWCVRAEFASHQRIARRANIEPL